MYLNLVTHLNDDLIAPHFMATEVTSALRQKVVRGEISANQALELLHLADSIEIRLLGGWDLMQRALELSEKLNQVTAYNAAYLSLAESEQRDLYTADEAFAKAASATHACMRVVQNTYR